MAAAAKKQVDGAVKAKRAAKPKRVKAERTPDGDAVITSVKGFNADLTCRGFQFEPGKTYTHAGAVEQCASGFHACPVEHHPFSVFEYYPPAGSRYFVVRQCGKTSNGGTKLASATITIDVELPIVDLVKRAWDYVWSRAKLASGAHVTVDHGAASSTGYQGAASSTGNYGAASSTGDCGAASSTGNRGAASSTGYQGAASSTGNRGAASSTGDCGAASSTGNRGAASSTGNRGAASSTGNYGAASSTGDCGAASSTGNRGAASSTGNYGAASSTGNYGAASSTGYQGAASSTGDCGAASSTGNRGAASSTGNRGAASSTGNYGAASSTGDCGAASSTGYQGAASSTGYQGAALASGYAGRVMGAEGNALFAVERDDDWRILSVAAGIVGQAGIEANVWYRAQAGLLVPA